MILRGTGYQTTYMVVRFLCCIWNGKISGKLNHFNLFSVVAKCEMHFIWGCLKTGNGSILFVPTTGWFSSMCCSFVSKLSWQVFPFPITPHNQQYCLLDLSHAPLPTPALLLFPWSVPTPKCRLLPHFWFLRGHGIGAHPAPEGLVLGNLLHGLPLLGVRKDVFLYILMITGHWS